MYISNKIESETIYITIGFIVSGGICEPAAASSPHRRGAVCCRHNG